MNDTYYEFGTAAERWDRARMFFEAKEYVTAARILGGLVDEAPDQVAPRLLLARAYYHSARLGKAEAELRAVLERNPVEDYAQLMLGRTLERQGRQAEAARYLRIAAAMTGDFVPPGSGADSGAQRPGQRGVRRGAARQLARPATPSELKSAGGASGPAGESPAGPLTA